MSKDRSIWIQFFSWLCRSPLHVSCIRNGYDVSACLSVLVCWQQEWVCGTCDAVAKWC